MRVIIDIRSLQQAMRNAPNGGPGGPGRYIAALTRGLLQRADGTTYDLLVDRGPLPASLRQLAEAYGAALHRVGIRGLSRRLSRGRLAPFIDAVEPVLLRQEVRAIRPHLVHFPDQPAQPAIARPSIITIHDVAAFLPSIGGMAQGIGPALSRRQTRTSVAAAAAIICVSEHTARDLGRLFATPADRLHVCYPGVDTVTFSPGPAPPSRFPGRYLLHVGVLRPRKNPDGLLRAFREVLDTEPSLTLVCTGPYQVLPGCEADLRRRITDLGLADRVHIAGDCTDVELAGLYRGAAALVFPSLYEGFGYPIAEALSCGTPVVTSAASSMPEAGGDVAVYVNAQEPADIARGIRRVLTDDAIRRRVQVEGPRWADRFSLATTSARMSLVYRDVWHRHAKGEKVQ